jgi:hypothetical protein
LDEDKPDARPLPIHRRTQAQNKRIHRHALSGIRTHVPSVHANEDKSCLRPRGHRDRRRRRLGGPKHKWDDKIKMYLGEIEGHVEWINVAQDRDQ